MPVSISLETAADAAEFQLAPTKSGLDLL
jgi:hypothetical protein